jgi:hypothetical protein
VFSARVSTPCLVYDRWTHLVRASYGKRELQSSGLAINVSDFQYTGLVEPDRRVRLQYQFGATRTDDESTDLQTDRIRNDVDVTYFHDYGRVVGGFGYETNDDDRSVTSYKSWRAGTVFRYGGVLTAKLDFASRNKTDEEEVTLLKDMESTRFRARLEAEPMEGVMVGASWAQRERDLPDVDVKIDGETVGAFGRYALDGWGALSGDYRFSDDDYDDRAGTFATESHIVTGRVELDRIPGLRLASGVTYMDIGEDLDIEKSMVFVEGAYTVLEDYRLEVSYNAYNYDDYIVVDRYYTANVVRISVAYDLHGK